MNERLMAEKEARATRRKLQAKTIGENTVNRFARPFEGQSSGNRILSASYDEHLKELKKRASIAAYNNLRALGVPIHNTRAAEVTVSDRDEVLGKDIIKRAAINVLFDIPYSNPDGKGVRTASIPVSYSDGKLTCGVEFIYQGSRYSTTARALNAISAKRDELSKDSEHTIVAVLTDEGHQIIGATEAAPAIVATLKTGGYRVAFRNPQDALNIEVSQPFYEVLPGGDTLENVKHVVAHLLAPQKKVLKTAQADSLAVPASTTPVESSTQVEYFREEVNKLEAVQAELEAAVDAYAEGLVKKAGYESSGDMQQKIAELKKQLTISADQLAAPLIQLRDGKVLAKISSVRINDPAWKSYLDAIGKRAKRMVSFLTRWVELFRTVTVSHRYEEIEPEDIQKTFKKQLKQREKLEEHQEAIDKIKNKAPAYLLNEAPGGLVLKKGQLEDQPDALLEHAIYDITDRADTEAQLLTQLEKEAKSKAEVDELNEEYPLPKPVAAAKGRATKPLSLSLETPLTDAQRMAVDGYKFSSAGAGKHGLFYRTAKKKIAKHIAAGFSEEEALDYIEQQRSDDHLDK